MKNKLLSFGAICLGTLFAAPSLDAQVKTSLYISLQPNTGKVTEKSDEIQLLQEKNLRTITIADTLKQGGASGTVLTIQYLDKGIDTFAVQAWDRKSGTFKSLQVISKGASGTESSVSFLLPGLVDLRIDERSDGPEFFSRLQLDYVPLDAWALFSTGYYAIENTYVERATTTEPMPEGSATKSEFNAAAPFQGVWLPLEAKPGSKIRLSLLQFLPDGRWIIVGSGFVMPVKTGASIHSYQFLPRGAGRYQVRMEILKGSIVWKIVGNVADVQPQYLQASSRVSP